MSKNPMALKKLIQDLNRIMTKERAAIKKRAYDKIGELAAQKSALMSEIDAFSGALNDNETTRELLSELTAVKQRAEENASILGAISKGVQRARLRLRSLDQTQRRAGVYDPKGNKLNGPNSATISTKA